ncbi:hypothetical protein L226DRAFT_182789 [Lentinus tigrinus ALCF2SS1-7]|uniref:Cytochrome b561 domain-containing protein n=1 Tax=Lentinus tigrinus ALCF2SS1-6 TaxID=1328759 RepID=A0A5C2SR77_9APHY|nr:hypothetical protein L227DRAFT_125225 [Lentinus tigrinus ALCF2SS1-6]RPD79829.1 hypothetical protein L226DRAFT_182789 [Lentinus tigrinus ALCF2SS1-7]
MQFSLARVPKPLLLVLLAFVTRLPAASALQGDSWCGTLMCVEATVNASTVTYELKALNQLGWMAIGFGSTMANTPMVVLWQIANGTIILSQRQASGRVEPLPVTHPPRLASLSPRANALPSVTPILAFDIPKDNDTLQSLIWAFGVTIPDASPNAEIEQHLDAGTLTLDLTKQLDRGGGSSSSSVASSQLGAGSGIATPTPPTPSQSSPSSASNSASRANSLVDVHAALSAAGFLILLPMGSLVARWSRIFTSKWFTAHWFINVVLGIPFICVGWALGPLAVAQQGREHIVTVHQICGVVLFALYIIEVALGTLIHMRRPKHGRAHPPRNVVHVFLGLTLFGLSIYETVNGIDRDPAVSSVSQNIVVAICIGWAAVSAPNPRSAGEPHIPLAD